MKIHVPFSKPLVAKNQHRYVSMVANRGTPWGGGEFSKLAVEYLADSLGTHRVVLTQSCTSGLELIALLLNIQPGDEVIVPSYTFVSSAQAFISRGAVPIFVDIDPDSMNLDVREVEKAVTSKTRAVVAVHYGGRCADMQSLSKICKARNIFLVEDAAQAIFSTYNKIPAGLLGDFAAFSFHGTKNLSSGEGGAVIINTSDQDFEAALTAQEKGTNRRALLEGKVDKYSWVSSGSSFVPSEFTAAVLMAQLESSDEIQVRRRNSWNNMHELIEACSASSNGWRILANPIRQGNSHMFCLISPDAAAGANFRSSLLDEGIQAPSHYVPLHNSPYSIQKGYSNRGLPTTESLAERVVRLPIWSAPNIPMQKLEMAVRRAFGSAT